MLSVQSPLETLQLHSLQSVKPVLEIVHRCSLLSASAALVLNLKQLRARSTSPATASTLRSPVLSTLEELIRDQVVYRQVTIVDSRETEKLEASLELEPRTQSMLLETSTSFRQNKLQAQTAWIHSTPINPLYKGRSFLCLQVARYLYRSYLRLLLQSTIQFTQVTTVLVATVLFTVLLQSRAHPFGPLLPSLLQRTVL